MKRIALCGWDVGFNKIGLTKLLQKATGASLSEAKAMSDSVLKNQTVTVDVPDERFDAFVAELSDLRVKFVLGIEEPR